MPASTTPYETIDLGTLGGKRSAAADVNDAGQVVGWSEDSSGAMHAFLWQDGVMRDLGTLGGNSSEADAVNDRGEVAGHSATAAGFQHAFLWSDGAMQDLGPWMQGYVRLNNTGHVAWIGTDAGGTQRGFVWIDGLAKEVGDPGSSTAYAINDLDQVVGMSNGRAFLWEHDTLRILPSLGSTAWAADVNNRGQVVGASYTPPPYTLHALLWEGDQMTDLGGLPGDPHAQATTINEQGQVGGQTINANFYNAHPFRWQLGIAQPMNLTYQSDPPELLAAMNGRGLAVGLRSGDFRAVVWEEGVTWQLSEGASNAAAVNAGGDVVGSLGAHAVLWRRMPAVAALPSTTLK
jgi:probable HAF family extracellular repeat protein